MKLIIKSLVLLTIVACNEPHEMVRGDNIIYPSPSPVPSPAVSPVIDKIYDDYTEIEINVIIVPKTNQNSNQNKG